jgi:hypothetical protein
LLDITGDGNNMKNGENKKNHVKLETWQ